MTRNLLAFFALLSGLAALSGTGGAAYAAPAAACNACHSASDIEACDLAQTQSVCSGKQTLRAFIASGREKGAISPIWVRGPIVMGVERAHE